MSIRLFKVVSYLLLAIAIASSLSGCARLGRRNCHPCISHCSEAVPAAKENLRIVKFESRELIQFTNVTNPIEGAPIASDPSLAPKLPPSFPTSVRDLSNRELQHLAGKAAPIANRLEAHRDWLNTLSRTPPGILEALAQQARFERSKHILMAQEAYLNLVNVYTKTPILNKTRDVLFESDEAIDKLRLAGVEIPSDPEELTRRRLAATEGLVEVRYNQQRLNDALESLLNLAHDGDRPIWTNYQSAKVAAIPTETEALESALSRRGDLVALVLLANNSQSLSIDYLRGGDASSGLFGAGFDLPGPARWWQCILKNEIECLKKSAQAERKRQLEMLVKNKQDQIRLEVRQSLHAIERHEGNLRLKLEQIDILRGSMVSSDKAKDYRPVDFPTRLQQRSDELKLISEIVDEMISLEIEHARLKHHIGEL
jgi:hypothetical protein